MQTSYSHDNDKMLTFEEFFDADDLQIAALISRAMLQSRKIKSEKAGNSVERLIGVLRDSDTKSVWHSNLILEKQEIRTVTIDPEHFEENFITQ